MAKLYFLPRALMKDDGRILRLGWRVEAALVSAFFALLRALPLSWARAIGRTLFRFLGPHTKVNTNVLRNMAMMHPEEPLELLQHRANRSFAHMGEAVAEIAHLPKIAAEPERFFEYEIDPTVAEVLRDPEAAAVLITAHVGPWTLTNFIAGHGGFPLTIVYAPESNPYIRDLILALRQAMPVRLTERDNSMRALLRELNSGHKVGLASDVRLDGGDLVPLFGVEMETNTVPARLALRVGCPLIPVTARRLPNGRFRIIAEAAIEPDDPEAPTDEQVMQMARKLAATYERWIEAAPEQWLCMARRWPKPLEIAALERARERSRR